MPLVRQEFAKIGWEGKEGEQSESMFEFHNNKRKFHVTRNK